LCFVYLPLCLLCEKIEVANAECVVQCGNMATDVQTITVGAFLLPLALSLRTSLTVVSLPVQRTPPHLC
jgi:hypothetical protein